MLFRPISVSAILPRSGAWHSLAKVVMCATKNCEFFLSACRPYVENPTTGDIRRVENKMRPQIMHYPRYGDKSPTGRTGKGCCVDRQARRITPPAFSGQSPEMGGFCGTRTQAPGCCGVIVIKSDKAGAANRPLTYASLPSAESCPKT